jgi:integrating conjugative element relaxase (TIGR03760 family)
MLKWLKKSLSGDSTHNSTAAEVASSIKTARLPAGFLPAESPDVLIASERRQQSLQIIQQVSSMPAPLYNTLCYQPLLALLARVQQVPAAETGTWSRQGGFGDLTLKFTACAVRLSKGYMFPPGAAPEEQSAQSSAWNAVVFWSALFHHLPLLARLEGELLNGECWVPGMTVPAQAYRFRFCKAAPTGSEAPAMASMMAGQLLPAEAVRWLSDTPPVLRNLAGALWNGHPEMPLIRDILKQSAAIVDAPPMGSDSPVAQAGKLATAPAPVPGVAVPSAELPAAGELPVTALAPDMLLSELASSVPAPQVKENVAATEPSEVDITPADADETDMLLSLFSAVPAEPEEHAEPLVAASSPVNDELSDEELVAQAAEPGDLPAMSADATEPAVMDTPEEALTDVVVSDAVLSAVPTVLFPDTPSEPDVEVKPVPDREPEKVARGSARNDAGEREDACQEGEAFLQWLKVSLRDGLLRVNGLSDKVHIVAGHVFLPVPGIFFEYLKQTGKEVDERERIQREFEQLNLCKRRDNKRFWFAHLQQDTQGQGGYKKLKGYLIKGRLIFTRVPQDSTYLSFP